jgi:hypothetical protein
VAGGRRALTTMARTEEPIFRFGVISDTQYCDAEDGTNFSGTRTRRCDHARCMQQCILVGSLPLCIHVLPASYSQVARHVPCHKGLLPSGFCCPSRYRHSLQVLERAIKDWNAHHAAGRPMSFVVQLGDALDGKAASLNQSVSAAEVRL